ncbi:MAG TPA: serine/threonine-protein kinase PknK [Planctomycetes bacterium]|nr:serine/threonine-protein kinase PknK [Planctomycetota bacterium]
MSENPGGSARGPRPSPLALIDEVCDRFEAAWKQGLEPEIETYLVGVETGQTPVSRRQLLIELITLDLEYRWMTAAQRGARPTDVPDAFGPAGLPLRPSLKDYVARFPELGSVDEMPEELVAHEHRVRRRWGGPVAAVRGPFALGPGVDDFYGTERFFVERKIGAGGMGVVYQAYDRQAQQVVAIKTIRNLEPTAIYRLKREFRSLSGIVHKNLVRLYELFSAGGWWFFTMEFIDGMGFLEYVWSPEEGQRAASSQAEISTRRQVGAGPGLAMADTDPARPEAREAPRRLAPTAPGVSRPGIGPPLSAGQLDRLRGALRQIAEGVAALHHSGKLHRDIKPSNVLVTPSGRVVLLDFGLATDFRQQVLSTTTGGHIVGTIPYMSPEQAAAESLSPATDMYSVGVMLYEALTGRCPFWGRQPLDMLAAKKEKDPPPPHTIMAEVPGDLDQLCVALLHRNPESRPSVAELLRRLGGVPRPVKLATASSAPAPETGSPHQAHLRTLAEALEGARRGRTGVVWVRGPAASGKTRLVRRFLENCRRRHNTVVLSGRCYQQESVPFKGVDGLVDALSHYLVKLPQLEADALMPRDTGALSEVFPVLARVQAVDMSRRRSAESLGDEQLRTRAFDALRELLARLGDRKLLVLSIDDFQNTDPASVELLRHLLRPPDPPVFLLLLCDRTESPQAGPPVHLFAQETAAGKDIEVRHIYVRYARPASSKTAREATLPRSGTRRTP